MSLKIGKSCVEPPIEEVEASSRLQEARHSLDLFLECTSISEKISNYSDLIIKFDMFLSSPQTKGVLEYYVPIITKNIFEFVQFIFQSISLLLETVNVLNHACELTQLTCEPQYLSVLMVGCFLAFQNSEDCPILSHSKNLFKHLFSDKTAFSEFSSTGGFIVIFNSIFVDIKSEKLADFAISLFFEEIPSENYEYIPYDMFFISVSNAIQEQSICKALYSKAALFTSFFFRSVSFYNYELSSFAMTNVFPIICGLLEGENDEDMKLRCYKHLANSANNDLSKPPNVTALQFLNQIYLKEKSLQKGILNILIESCFSFPDHILYVDTYFPFSNWFVKGTHQQIKIVEMLDKLAPKILPKCLPSFFETTDKITKKTVDILCKCVFSNSINIQFLSDSQFLDNFLMKASDKSVINLFLNSPGYLNIVSRLFPNYANKETLFGRILSLVDYFINDNNSKSNTNINCNENVTIIDKNNEKKYADDNGNESNTKSEDGGSNKSDIVKTNGRHQFVVICSTILSNSPSAFNISQLLPIIDRIQDSDFACIFQAIFMQKKEAAEAFVSIGGIDWVFGSQYLSQTMVVNLLSSLVYNCRFEELDEAIKKLPKDHFIFALSQRKLEKIVYGLNTSTYRPIRVYSLTYLLKFNNVIDPFNAWMLGNSFVDHMLLKSNNNDLMKVPLIEPIFNRFVLPKFVDLILSNPLEIYKFCNIEYDHFPLFQLFPGQKSLIFEKTFTAMTFWFRFQDEVTISTTFFKTDILSFSIDGNKYLTISCKNNDDVKLEVNCQKWTFVCVKLTSKLLSNQVSVQINSDFHTSFSVKNKTSNVSMFSASGNTLLFLGSAVRFFMNDCNEDSIRSQGPGYITLSETDVGDKTVTPYLITVPSTDALRFQKPPTCVSVPYFGLPMHFLSLRMLNKLISVLQNSSTKEEFASVYQSLININTITRYNSVRFWPKLLNALKKCKPFLSKTMFIDALKSVSQQQEREKILSSILFDSEMWRYVSNEILIESLFEHFSGVKYEEIENFELFLASVILENPSSITILTTILNNHQRLPKLVKYIKNILKTAPAICHNSSAWDAIEFRDVFPIQHTILDAFLQYTTTETFPFISSIISFEDLKGLFAVSPPSLATKVFLLITQMTLIDHSFLKPDRIMLAAVSVNSSQLSLWDCILRLADENITDVSPLVMVLIWCAGICVVHKNIHSKPSDTAHFEKLEGYMGKAIDYCMKNMARIIEMPESLALILGWYSLIFHYNALFQAYPEGFPKTDNFQPETYNVSQFPEVQDSLWIGVDHILKDFAFPPQKKPQNPTQFMLQLVSQILTTNSFSVNFTALNTSQSVEWLVGSKIVDFLSSIILSAPQQWFGTIMHSFFFTFFFSSQSKSDPFAPLLLDSILKKFAQNYTPWQTSQLFAYTHLLAGLQMLSDHSLQTIEDLFTLASIMTIKESMFRISSLIHPILLILFQSAPVTVYEKLFALLTNHVQLFAQIIISQRALYCWLYTFLVPSMNTKQCFEDFFRKFVSVVDFSPKDHEIVDSLLSNTLHSDTKSLSMLESSWKAKSQETQSGYQILFKYAKITPPRFPIEVSALSNDFSKYKFLTNVHHYLISHLLMHSLRFLNSTFLIMEEKTQWAHLINKLRDQMSEVQSFKPKSYILSPQSFPFTPPNLLSPSPFAEEEITKSNAIQLYKKAIKYVYSATNDLNVNMLRMFIKIHKNEYGTPKFIFPCEILRYTKPFPSVMIMYPEIFVFITYSKLNDAENDLDMNSINPEYKEMHLFLESVFIGHWGQTTIFGSKIVLRLPKDNIIYVHQLSETSLNFWTFSTGAFILNLAKNNLQTVMNNSPKLSPATPFLFDFRSIEEARYKYTKKLISAYQFLCVVNCLSGRSFSDIENYPIFPFVYNRNWSSETELPSNSDILSVLSKIAPFNYYLPKTNNNRNITNNNQSNNNNIVNINTDDNSRAVNIIERNELDSKVLINKDLPAICFCLTQFYDKVKNLPHPNPISHISYLRHEIERPEVMLWAAKNFKVPGKVVREQRTVSFASNYDNTQVTQLLSLDGTNSTILFASLALIVKLPLNTAVANHIETMAVVLCPEMMSLSFVNIRTNQVYFRKRSHLFAFATNLSVAANGLMLTVDYRFGMTRVYRIYYKDRVPSYVHTSSIFGWNMQPRSIISGTDWVIASMCHNELTIWNVFASTIHRIIEMEDEIVQMAFDETISSIWLLTTKKAVFLHVNGEFFCETEVDERVTALTVLRLPKEQIERSAIIGTESGTVYSMQPCYEDKSVKLKKLPSEHKSPIVQITVHESNRTFATVSEDGKVYAWNAVMMSGTRLSLEQMEHCANCNDKPICYCTSCNRGICQKCALGGVQAELCPTCFEFMEKSKQT